MTWFRAMVTALVLLWWLPASNHCRLEQVPTLSFFVCGDHEDTLPHQDDDCATDGCASVETASYKIEDAKVVALMPEWVVLFDLAPDTAVTAAAAVPGPRPAEPPRELPRIWQFSHRAAAPPRAPSFAS